MILQKKIPIVVNVEMHRPNQFGLDHSEHKALCISINKMEYFKILNKVSESKDGIIFKGKNLLNNRDVLLKKVKLENLIDGIPASVIR